CVRPAVEGAMRGSGRISAFFCTVPRPAEIYTLSLHDALPICARVGLAQPGERALRAREHPHEAALLDTEEQLLRIQERCFMRVRSEEHTSELQSRFDLVCRLLLEKKERA